MLAKLWTYTISEQFKSVNNNNKEKKLAAQFLQRHTIHGMSRTCITAIAVMVVYISNDQFLFHLCPLFISDKLVQVIFWRAMPAELLLAEKLH